MEKRTSLPNLKIEGARLVCRNFRGAGSEFNEEGDRNFGVLLSEELAQQLEEDGWNVKRFKPRANAEDPEYRQPWLKVKVSYKKFEPIVVLINERGKMKLHEDTIDQLDWTRIKNCDLIIHPSPYKGRGLRPDGISCYMNSIYVTVMQDDLDENYADLPWIDE